jgi:hypothetical protein
MTFLEVALNKKKCERRLDLAAEKVNFHGLLKNAQMQGSSFDRLRINSPEE